jgi:hypothetical protein
MAKPMPRLPPVIMAPLPARDSDMPIAPKASIDLLYYTQSWPHKGVL